MTAAKDYAKILLQSKGDRDTDEFIEVHIYGGFDNNAVSEVKWTPSPKQGKHDLAMKEIVKELLTEKGIDWIEE